MTTDREWWAAPVGAVVVVTLLLALAFIGATDVTTFVDFLKGPAAGWAQALGAILAIVVTARLAREDARVRRLERIADEASRVAELFAPVLALLEAAFTQMRKDEDALSRDDVDWDLVARSATETRKVLHADLDEIRPFTLPSVNAIRFASEARHLVADTAVLLEGMAFDAQQNGGSTDYQSLADLDEQIRRIDEIRRALQSEMVSITRPDDPL